MFPVAVFDDLDDVAVLMVFLGFVMVLGACSMPVHHNRFEK